MELQLSSEELEVLRDIVSRELGNIKEEVYRTDSADYKDMVKAREATIMAILNKLQGDAALAT